MADWPIMSLQIDTFELPPIGTNAFLVRRSGSTGAVVVDAPLNAFATVERILVREGLRLEALLLTHGHWDHILDAHRFNAFGTTVYGNEGDRALFETPELMRSFSIPALEMNPVTIDRWLEDGDELKLLGTRVEVRAVPGHAPGSLLFYFPNEGVAFSGDAIFRGSIGRYDLPLGDFPTLERSIRERIYTLPEETVLYPGHGPATTVGEEMRSNPFVRAIG